MKFQLDQRYLILINGVGMALAVAVLVLLYQIDMIVHGALYEYGLQFHYEWAIPYWTFERLMLGLLGVIAIVNGFCVATAILSNRAPPQRKPVSVARAPKPGFTRERNEIKKEKTPEPKEGDKPKVRVRETRAVRDTTEDGVEVIALPMVCSKCGKVFSQPLCMFDFKSGKPRLVNVCPYCNAVLAVSGNSKSE